MDIITGSEIEAVWYVPDFEDNREKGKDAAAVLITPLTGAELIKIEHGNLLTRQDQKSKDVGALLERRQWALKMKCLDKHVTGVKNFFRKDAKTGKRAEIKEFGELKDLILKSDNAVLLGVLNDISNALLDRSVLDEGMIKN